VIAAIRFTTVAFALGALAVAPAGAYAQDPEPPGVGEARAEAVLAEAQELLQPGAAAEPTRDLTLVLAELSQLQRRLDPTDRAEANAILARPDDGANDRYGDGYEVDEADESPYCDAEFCVHWVEDDEDAPDLTDTGGAPGVPDFVEATLASAQDSFEVENGDLDWVEPLSDGARGGGGAGLTDVYLLETNGDYFGYASPDENQGAGAITSKFGYMVLDDDFEEFTDGELTELEALQATMAHEYNHVLQFTYDAREESWMLESTATWIEEQVYPDINDYLRYVDAFADTPAVPLTRNANGVKIYGAALWNHYLTGIEGPDVIRDAWEDSDSATPPSLSVAAYDSALGGSGANPFDDIGDAFAGFAAASAEWRALPALFADAAMLPDALRSGRLRPSARATRLRLDHLAYRLAKVRPGAAADGLELRARGPEGVQFGLALVARTGSPAGGTVTSDTAVMDDGGGGTVELPAGAYDRVTAVIANADATVTLSRRYRSDGSDFKLRLVP
jgi:Family of unknown function (DUF6055)